MLLLRKLSEITLAAVNQPVMTGMCTQCTHLVHVGSQD